MKRLTISHARDLIKRELGISAAALTAPDDMNSNLNYPWYEMRSGTTHIVINTDDVRQSKYTDKMVALDVTHENSNKGTTEYFYSDTLQYAAPYTEWKNREVFCDIMDSPETNPALLRLKREALDDCWKHFHKQPITQDINADDCRWSLPVISDQPEKERTPFNDLLVSVTRENGKSKTVGKPVRDNDPER